MSAFFSSFFIAAALIAALLVLVACCFLWLPVRRQLGKKEGRWFWLPILIVPLLAFTFSYPQLSQILRWETLKQEFQQRNMQDILAEELATLETRLKQDPGNTRLRLDLGRFYYLSGNSLRASSVLEHPILQSDEDARALLLRMHYETGYQNADPAWSEELASLLWQLEHINPEHPTFLSVLAAEQAAAGNRTEALRLLNRLLVKEQTPAGREKIMQLIRKTENLPEQATP